MLNYKELYPGRRVRLVSSGERFKLMLSELTEEDSGPLELRASNYLGSANAQTKIIVECKCSNLMEGMILVWGNLS